MCPAGCLHRSIRKLGMFGDAVRGPLVCVTGRQWKAVERSQEVMGHDRNLADVREKLKRPARVSRSKKKAVERSFLG